MFVSGMDDLMVPTIPQLSCKSLASAKRKERQKTNKSYLELEIKERITFMLFKKIDMESLNTV